MLTSGGLSKMNARMNARMNAGMNAGMNARMSDVIVCLLLIFVCTINAGKRSKN